MPYTIAIYLRFSHDDGNTAENDSIVTQRGYLKQYISEHEDLRCGKVTEFIDDGYTGLNFKRPSFQKMIEAAKKGEIQCIIMKDFSRLGRQFYDVCDYIDQIFPFLGVRLIAVNEHYDSTAVNAAMGLDMVFRNFMHSVYSKDLSKKILTAKKTAMYKGEYSAPFAFYGYEKSPEVKKHIVIDPPAAEIVKRIFECAGNCEKARNIAIRLNNESILTPNEYNKQKNIGKNGKQHYITIKTKPLWTADIVREIIQDERYTGKMVCGRYRRINNRVIQVSKSEWIITPNTHEAIVSDEIWQKAQGIFGTRKEITMPDTPKSIFVGKLTCGHCGKKLVYESHRNPPFFYCHNFNMGLGCEEARVYEHTMKKAIFSVICAKLDLVQSFDNAVKTKTKLQTVERSVKKRELEQQLKKLELSQTKELERYFDGEIGKDEYIKFKETSAATIREVMKQLFVLNVTGKSAVEDAECHRPFYSADELTREMLTALIKEIRVCSADSIEIAWIFSDYYTGLSEK